jgi:thioredoxin reductase
MTMHSEHDYLIIGAGPAGLQLGYFLEKNGRDYLILEACESAGAFFEQYPRHRKLLSINKIHTGYVNRDIQLRYDWNSLLCEDERLQFRNYSKQYFPHADAIKHYCVDFANFHGLNITYNTRVCNVAKQGDFIVTDEQGNQFSGKRLIIATGTPDPYIPDVPGIEYAESYADFPIDPEDYTDQRVLILGKGNSAFETADALTETARIIHLCSPNSIKLAWASHFSGHLRAVNNNFVDTYHLKGQNSVHDAQVVGIERKNGELIVDISFTHAKGQHMWIAYDRVLVCTGFRFNSTIFDATCQPEMAMNNRFPAMTSSWESTNIKDLYFAGTITQVRDFHKTSSNVYHGFRYNIDFLSRFFEETYHDRALPYHKLARDDERALAELIINRVSISSALFLQFSFIGDLLVVPEGDEPLRYYESIPVDYIYDSAFGQGAHYYVITLEYGEFGCNPLNIERDPDPNKAHLDRYLHPVIRCFAGRTLLCEYHIPENLENDWRETRGPGEIPYLLSFDFPGYDGPQRQPIFTERLAAFFRDRFTQLADAQPEPA